LRVYRYDLHPPEKLKVETSIKLPKGSQILTIDVKDGVPSIWAMVDPNQPDEDRALLILPTGIEVPKDWKYMRFINTIILPKTQPGQETLCFHIFEKGTD
jgi:hypothetical protein